MPLPDRVHFKVTTSLSAEAVLQRLRDCTIIPRARNRGKKTYLGRIQGDRFELTRKADRTQRKKYKSTLPAVPMITPISILFMKGSITPEANGTSVDITINPQSAITNRWRDMFTVGVIAPVSFLLLFVPIFLIVFSVILGKPIITPESPIMTPAGMQSFFQDLGRSLGSWVGVGVCWGGFTLFDINRYKSRFEAIVEIEKEELTQLLQH